ncbi:MAG: hypothetical protein DRI32_02420 [Chloroflexi bacterium]|nr:MAG: hypothetical protein DRI32_02420 [Chloroflexota bacterium]
MLDNLREDAEASPYFEEDEIPDFLEDEEEEEKPKTNYFAFLKPITSMTSMQRFLIVALLFMAVWLIGSMCLLVTGSLSLF